MALSPDEEAAFKALAQQFVAGGSRTPTPEDIAELIGDLMESELLTTSAAHLGGNGTEGVFARFPVFAELAGLARDPEAAQDIARRIEQLETAPTGSTTDLDLAAEFEPLLWLLNRVGDGINLTQAGYLPPAVAGEFRDVLHSSVDRGIWRGGESHMRQLAAYRRYVQRLGLLRKYRGKLLLTRAGEAARVDPSELWNHLADRLASSVPAGTGAARDFDRDASAFTLLYAATSAGGLDLEGVAALLTSTGWEFGELGPVRRFDVSWSGACPAVLFWFMGPQEEREWHSTSIRPAAVALAREALLRTRRSA